MGLFSKIFGSPKEIEPADLTTIIRTEVIEGLSTPGIIKNMQHYYTDLQVYSDGLISCWGMVDLQMFKQKLSQNWVVTSIPDGQQISVFDLGLWYIDKGEWIHTEETFYSYIHSLVKRLNPTLENLYNYNGSDSKTVGKASVAKHFLPSAKPYYYEDPESFLPSKSNGEKLPIFFKNDDDVIYLSELSLYKSGHVEITNIPTKKAFKFDELEKLANSGKIITDLKRGERVSILGLGSFVVTSGDSTDMKLKLDEFTDKFNELNGRENSIAKCARIFEEYTKQPTRELQEELKAAYEAVPEHKRIFVGTMDTKDYEVRHAIYGDIVKQEFEEENGYEYPYDDMPKPIDE